MWEWIWLLVITAWMRINLYFDAIRMWVSGGIENIVRKWNGPNTMITRTPTILRWCTKSRKRDSVYPRDKTRHTSSSLSAVTYFTNNDTMQNQLPTATSTEKRCTQCAAIFEIEWWMRANSHWSRVRLGLDERDVCCPWHPHRRAGFVRVQQRCNM